MKTLLHLTFALLLLCDDSEGQSYNLLSEVRFATRINFNNPTNPQQSRVAGADHMVTKPSNKTIGLDLRDDGGMVLIDGKEHMIAADSIGRLRLGGGPIVLAKEFEIYLSSDAVDRSRAMLIVRHAIGVDKPIIYLLNLELTTDDEKKKQNKSEQATPRKPSD